jgi:hypothetical protein
MSKIQEIMPQFYCQGEQKQSSTPKFNQELNCQNIVKQESSKIANTLFSSSTQESGKIVNVFLHTQQESSKTTVAREGSIKIELNILTPKSLRSRMSIKSWSALPYC